MRKMELYWLTRSTTETKRGPTRPDGISAPPTAARRRGSAEDGRQRGARERTLRGRPPLPGETRRETSVQGGARPGEGHHPQEEVRWTPRKMLAPGNASQPRLRGAACVRKVRGG